MHAHFHSLYNGNNHEAVDTLPVALLSFSQNSPCLNIETLRRSIFLRKQLDTFYVLILFMAALQPAVF